MLPGCLPTLAKTVERAQGTLPEALGIHLAVLPAPQEGHPSLRIGWPEGEATFRILEKPIRRTEDLAIVRAQTEDRPRMMLVSPHLTEHLARRCVEMGIQFLDGTGNIHVTGPGLFLCILGNKVPEAQKVAAGRPGFKGFNRKGLQVLFGLLTGGALLDAPYRELGAATGVARGTVGEVITDLLGNGLLLQNPGKRIWLQRARLIEGWVANYPYKLRPHLQPRTYQAVQPKAWDQVVLDPQIAQWGGEVAADRLTGALRPHRMTLYASIPHEKLAAQLRLRPDPGGDVEILERFWHFPNVAAYPADLVPPLLIFADLVASGDPRNADLARTIHDAHLDS